jgi:ubiquinone/menaquinone biosynthesis C-methylase UbiE
MKDEMITVDTVAAQYHRENLTEGILDALKDAGWGEEAVTADALAPIDEFHIRGAEATREMIELAGFQPEHHVLDVGSGIGGPSRQLAQATGCRVTGLDLTEAYCQTARELAAMLRLQDLTDYRQGNALAMPFEDEAFDGAWTQHVTMNIADKEALLLEVHRVLKPAGRLVMYEIIAGPGGPIHFPVPWANKATISHLVERGSLEADLKTASFRVESTRDVSEASAEWFAGMIAANQATAVPTLGLHVLVGPDMKEKGLNVLRNLEEDRVRVIQLVATKE